MKPVTLLCLLGLLAVLGTPAARALNPGDIAFIGFNADGSDDAAFVALVDIAEGTEILLTDNEWTGGTVGAGGTFSPGEGVMFWLPPIGGITAGTVVRLNGMTSGTPNATPGILGAVEGSLDLDESGEALFAYQAPFTNPVLEPTGILAAIGNDTAAATGNDLTGSGLSEGTGNALFLPGDEDVMAYNGLRVTQAAFADYLPFIANPANWVTEDGTGDQSANGITPDIPFDSTAFVLGGTAPALTLSFPTGSSAAENAGAGAISGRVTRSGSTVGTLAVSIAISDATEASSLPTVTIPNGSAFADFDIDAIDDQWPDGPQSVVIMVSATNFTDDTQSITITDDGSDTFSVIVNEVYYGVSGSMLDANGDGTADQSNGGNDDEFVEVVNTTASPINIAGLKLHDNSGNAFHTFPGPTILGPGCALVVFGGGDVPEGSLVGAFGTAEVQLANGTGAGGGLYLDDGGDFVSIRDGLGNEIHSVSLPDQSATPDAGSYTLAIDGDGSSGHVYHTTTAGMAAFSPGTRADGSDFCTLVEPDDLITVTINNSPIPENAGTVTGAATISLPAVPAQPVTVHLSSSDTSELTVAASVVITPPASSINISLTAVDDPEIDGTQTVTLGARASGYLNGSNTIDVDDQGDAPAFTDLVINELDCQMPGTDSAEFIELFNRTDSPQPLDGLVLVLFNGALDVVYDAIDLSGQSIPASGFFVIGSGLVPNVDLAPFGTNGLQNGVDAAAIFVGTVGDFPDGTPLSPIGNTLVDALVYSEDNATDAELLAALTPGQSVVSENAGGSVNTHSISRLPDGGAAFDSSAYTAQRPTPGATNVLPPSDFETWLGDQGYSASGFATDSDGDGQPNGAEWYFYATSPDAANTHRPPLTFATEPGDDGLSFTHLRPVNRNGVIETYQWSTNLDGTWHPSNASVNITPGASVPNGPDYETVFVSVAFDPMIITKLFLRLMITEEP